MHSIKILIVGTRGFPGVQGGVEKHCEELYPRIVALGCNVIVLARAPYFSKEKRIAQYKNVRFIYLWTAKYPSLEAIIHTFIGALIAIVIRPDIVHVHAIGPSLSIPLLKISGLKTIMTHHGPDYERKKWGKFAKFVLKCGELFAVKFADKIICVSKNIKGNVSQKYNRDDIEYIPNGVTVPDIPENRNSKIFHKFGIEPKKYVFTACRFVPEKGLHDLIEAYLSIDKPEFKLVIAGDSDHPDEYSNTLKELVKSSSNIILTGIVTGSDLYELYSNSSLFVLPSYYEGLPIVLLEALSYGLPALASDIPQNREIPLAEFRYFRTGDIDDLSEKMQELIKMDITDDEKRHYQELLEKEYNWDKIARQTFEVYKSVI